MTNSINTLRTYIEEAILYLHTKYEHYLISDNTIYLLHIVFNGTHLVVWIYVISALCCSVNFISNNRQKSY